MESVQQPDTDLALGQVSSPSVIADAKGLVTQLQVAPEKMQAQLVQEIAALGEAGLLELVEFLRQRLAGSGNRTEAKPEKVDLLAGKVYQTLVQSGSTAVGDALNLHFPQGIVPLCSDLGIDYAPLQRLLAAQHFQSADQMTLQKLCELAGTDAVQRKWIYFTEVKQLPIVDLQTINLLWLTHSEGKFGFSVQRELWLGVGQNWEKLWSKIGWKNGNNWTRYPQEFTWDLTAPRGHLPLSNQLRGVQVIAALMAHPAWS